MDDTSVLEMSKRKLDDQDPEYEDTSEHETKRLRKLEKNAKLELRERIISIVKNQFAQELENKEKEVLQINERIEETRKLLYYLRYAIVTNFYERNQLKVKVDPPEQTRIHPAVKKLIGKQPLNIFSTPQPRSCTIKSSNKDSISLNIKQENNIELVENEQLNQKNETNDNQLLESNEEDNSLKKIPRYIPPKLKETPILGNNLRAPSQRFKKRIVIGNISKWLTVDNRQDNTSHKWMMYVRGPKDDPDVSDFIKKVRFFLHPSYKPNDVIEVCSAPFHLSKRGWGEFPLRVQIHFTNIRNKPIDIIHHLRLDQTYTGLQTLGGETVIDVWLYNKGDSLSSYIEPDSTNDLEDNLLQSQISLLEKNEDIEKQMENENDTSYKPIKEENITICHDERNEIFPKSLESQITSTEIKIKTENDVKEEVIEENIEDESSNVVIDDVVFNWQMEETPILNDFPQPVTSIPLSPPPSEVNPTSKPLEIIPERIILKSPLKIINPQIVNQIKTSLHSKPVEVNLPSLSSTSSSSSTSNIIIKKPVILKTINQQIKESKPVYLFIKDGSLYKINENTDNNNISTNINQSPNAKIIKTKIIPKVSLLNKSLLKSSNNQISILNSKLINNPLTTVMHKPQMTIVNKMELKPGESLLKTNTKRNLTSTILNCNLNQQQILTKQIVKPTIIQREIKIDLNDKEEKKCKKIDPGILKYEEYIKEFKERVDSCKFSSIGQCIRWLITSVPLITPKASDPQYRVIHPYSATSYTQFHQWPIGKQRACEWYRALKIRETLLSIGHPPENVWTTRAIVVWARYHGYTKLSDTKSDDEEKNISLEKKTSFSEPVDIFETVENLSENIDDNDSDCEIDVISINTPNVKVEPEENNYEYNNDDESNSIKSELLTEITQTMENPYLKEEINSGLTYPSPQRVILKAVNCLIEDILRKAFEKAWERNSFIQPTLISVQDVISALLEHPKFDYFTRENIGIELNEKI